MICERCSLEIDAITCSRCGEIVVRLGPFCYACGASLSEQAGSSSTEGGLEQAESAIDFSQRLLCSDGTCIGVVNEQGTCKVCGKPYTEES
jgi:hypothetical protein